MAIVDGLNSSRPEPELGALGGFPGRVGPARSIMTGCPPSGPTATGFARFIRCSSATTGRPASSRQAAK